MEAVREALRQWDGVPKSLRQLCEQRTRMSPPEIQMLERIDAVLPCIADLTGGDIFIDVMDVERGYMFAVAQARPRWGSSAYCLRTVGMPVMRENEPAVYHSYETGMPVRDLKGITQENIAVKQDVIPIQNEAERTIAVLIHEEDISRSIQQEKKYQELVREKQDGSELLTGLEGLEPQKAALREIHHRVKNNLQMVASILSLQARKSDHPEVKRAFKETTGRVLSIAAIHDMLTSTQDNEIVNIKPLLERIMINVRSLGMSERDVEIEVTGDELRVPSDKATSIALVVNELVTNSLEHGFPDDGGAPRPRIVVSIQKGRLYSTISVQDNGVGFDTLQWGKNSLGQNIVSLTIQEKLGAKLRLSSGSSGTKVMFDFKL